MSEQMQANFPRVYFLGTLFSLERGIKIRSRFFTSSIKSESGVVRGSRAVTTQKCTIKRDARAKLLFCLTNPLPFFRPKNASLFTLLNQLGPVYVEVGDPR